MSRFTYLTTQGLKYLLDGDFRRILRYLLRRTHVTSMLGALRASASERIESVGTPTWVSSEQSVSTVLKLAEPSIQYRSVLDPVQGTHEFAFSEAVAGLDLEIVTPALDTSTLIHVTNDVAEESISVHSGEWQPSFVPISINFDRPTRHCTLLLERNRRQGWLPKGVASANRLLGRLSLPMLSLPHPRGTDEMPPIVLLS